MPEEGFQVTNEELVSRYQNGEYAILDELTENNLKLIRFICNKFYIKNNFIDFEDLEQQGWIGFYRAVQTYDPDKPNSAKFSTWSIYWIRAAIGRYLKKNNSKFDETSLSAPIGDNGETELADFIEAPDDDEIEMWRRLENQELRLDLETLMEKYLTLHQREFLKLYFAWDGAGEWTYEELGTQFGMSPQGARSIVEGALRRLRQTHWVRLRARERLLEERITLFYDNPVLTLVINSRLEKQRTFKRTVEIPEFLKR
jgi:RNA polymerase sigma factor (sigma-70 family)